MFAGYVGKITRDELFLFTRWRPAKRNPLVATLTEDRHDSGQFVVTRHWCAWRERGGACEKSLGGDTCGGHMAKTRASGHGLQIGVVPVCW